MWSLSLSFISQILELHPIIVQTAEAIDPAAGRNARLAGCDTVAAHLRASLAEIPEEIKVHRAGTAAGPAGGRGSLEAWSSDRPAALTVDAAGQAAAGGGGGGGGSSNDELESPVIRMSRKPRGVPFRMPGEDEDPCSSSFGGGSSVGGSSSFAASFSIDAASPGSGGGIVGVGGGGVDSARLQALEKTMATLVAAQEAMGSERAGLARKVLALEEANTDLQEANAELRQEVAELRDDFEGLEGEHCELKEDFTTWREDHAAEGGEGDDGRGSRNTSQFVGL